MQPKRVDALLLPVFLRGRLRALPVLAAVVVCPSVAHAQASNDPFDVPHRFTVSTAVAPTSSSADWTRRLRAKARVGLACFELDGLVWDPTANNVPAAVVHTSYADADAGQNNLTTATTNAAALWGSTSATDFFAETRVWGGSNPVSDRCIGLKKRAASAKAEAKSKLKLKLEGDKAGAAGAKGFGGAWVNRQNLLRKSKRKAQVVSDPLVARIFDSAGTLVGEWETVRIDSTVRGDGETRIDSFGSVGGLSQAIYNSAPDMELYIRIGSPIVQLSDRGVLHVVVENNVITKRVLTGRFASVVGIPALNSTSGAWIAPIDLEGIDYDMLPHVSPLSGPTRVEFEMSGGSHSEAEGGLAGQVCSLVTDIGRGFDFADISSMPAADSELGLSCLHNVTALLDHVTLDFHATLDHLVVPYIVPGAPPGTAPAAVYVRLFDGNPAFGGTLLYGSLGTPQPFNPSVDVESREVYRVSGSNQLSATHHVNEVRIDLSLAPTVPDNTAIWIEVSMIPPAAFADIQIPPSPFADNSQDAAHEFSFASGSFAPRVDAGSGRLLCLPFELYATPYEAPVVAYCTAGTTTNGCLASISANANPNVANNAGVTIAVANVEGQKQGLIFYGVDNSSFPPVPWGSGSTSFLCVKSPTQRTGPQSSGGSVGACNGALALNWDAFVSANPTAIGVPFGAGDKVYVQAWFRDPPAPKTTNLSNAIELTVQP